MNFSEIITHQNKIWMNLSISFALAAADFKPFFEMDGKDRLTCFTCKNILNFFRKKNQKVLRPLHSCKSFSKLAFAPLFESGRKCMRA
jgi:hypothetical protein